MDEEQTMKLSEITCRYAQERYNSILLWRNLWSILLFVFGFAIIVFALILLYFVLKQELVESFLTGLPAVVDCIAIKWVVDRRKESVQEEADAYAVLKEACARRTELNIDTLTEKYRLFRNFR